MKCVFVILLLVVYPFTEFAKADAPAKSTQVQILQDGKVIATIDNLEGTLQVRAADMIPDDDKNTIILKGNVHITAKKNQNSPIHISASEAKVGINRIEVQVLSVEHFRGKDGKMRDFNRLRDIIDRPSVIVMQALYSALKQFPSVPKFRVSFGGALGGSGSNSVVLYNRTNHTIKYWNKGYWGEGQYGSAKAYLYTDVTDFVIHQLVEDHKNDPPGQWHGLTTFLTDYGSTKRLLFKQTWGN